MLTYLRLLGLPEAPRLLLALLTGVALILAPRASALGEARYVEFAETPRAFALVQGGQAASVWVDAHDHAGVIRAVEDFRSDIGRVTGITPDLALKLSDSAKPLAVIVGTLGKSGVIDQLVHAGKVNPQPIAGKWESFVVQVVEAPFEGMQRALVVIGSDKRGTIYALYELSEQMGVSPWYWWADVPTPRRDALFVAPGPFVKGPPSVKYRGIFLNDEAPDLTNWIRAKFGDAAVSPNPPVPPGIANYGREFYQRLFEVILRLRGNYLWPAMWNNAFNEDDPENARLADLYGVVMGTSHQEPMLRAQKEWDRRFQATLGNWNYAKNPAEMQTFWREGVRRNKAFESIVTIGLRGANDTEMAPGGPAANRALLEQIVDEQRIILREEVNPDVTQVPQLWCLYKEVQDYYEAGMRTPNDVTLLWAEDNWGNVRRLPTPAERLRPGGAGVYYHFDYHGGPRSYQWLNTSPLPKIWDQMSLAKDYGADRIWIVNVGHFKGYEIPTEFFLNLAWNTKRWTGENIGEFTRLWAAREFGAEYANDIAAIVDGYAKFNGRRKPELLSPAVFSLVNYREAERVVADFKAIAEKAEALVNVLPQEKRDAFYQLVLFPTRASALVNALYWTAGKNELYAQQGRASANAMAAETRRLFQADLDLMAYYNTAFANGRWAHFMDQSHLGYTTWRDPPKNSLDAIKLTELVVPEEGGLGVAIEGSDSSWPSLVKAIRPPALPRFDALNRQRSYIDVFNRGAKSFTFQVRASAPWIVLSETSGTVDQDRRIGVSIDWLKVPLGTTTGFLQISGAKTDITVTVEVLRPDLTRENLDGFAEAAGYIAIEPEHFSRRTDMGAYRWEKIVDYGRTLSGLRATAPVDSPVPTPGTNSPSLEYRVYVYSPEAVEVDAITAPTLNFIPGQPVRYAVSFDDEAPQTVELVPADYKAQNRNGAWEKSVADNAHHGRSKHVLSKAGYHVLKIWMIDPAVVMQKIVLDLGEVRPSYLGPPETYYRLAGQDRTPAE